MKKLIQLSILFSLVTSASLGQEAAATRHFRIFLVEEVPKPPDDLLLGKPESPAPPSEITVEQEGGEMFSTGLKMSEISGFIPFPSEAKSLDLHAGKSLQESPWLQIPMMEESPLLLTILYPQQKKEPWKQPLSLTVRDDLEAFPLGEARFANVSDHAMVVRIGKGRAFKIPSRGMRKAKLKSGGERVVIGVILKNGRFLGFFDNTMKVKSDQSSSASSLGIELKTWPRRPSFTKGPRSQRRPLRGKRKSRAILPKDGSRLIGSRGPFHPSLDGGQLPCIMPPFSRQSGLGGQLQTLILGQTHGKLCN